MKIKINIVPLFLICILGFAEGNEGENGINSSVCREITALESKLHSSSKQDKVLFELGKISSKIPEVSIEQYKKNKDYKTICHLKIVKSENFGDFTSYNGYHFQTIIDKYPQSNFADDAAYALIYIITDDVYNFDDAKVEREKLLQFIKTYPKSNLINTATKRVKAIDYDIKHGVPTIMD